MSNQCPARVDIESSRSESEKNSLSLLVREVKSEMKIWFTHFENEKWKANALNSRSRVKSEMKMPWDRDREWKVKWKCLEIESEKWNFSRILEKFLRIKKKLIHPLCVSKCLFKLHIWVNAILHWLHLVEFIHCRFQMCPQITYLTFPHCVCQVCLQIYIQTGCIVTKIALVKTLPTLCPTTIFFVLK